MADTAPISAKLETRMRVSNVCFSFSFYSPFQKKHILSNDATK